MQCTHLQSAAPLPKLQTRRARRQSRAPSHRRPSASQAIGSVLEFLDLFSAGGTISSGTTTSECDTTMKTILIAAALLCSVEVRAMAESTVTFRRSPKGLDSD